ncbi:alpha/beta hydrolase [Amycolatopsis ultiminotia]|uniref:Alpha/beta hydrolase n=1 Tax=Amycolatopsis ultiminotia TaxID=543629 RepID=A0ABP6UUM0_9PSEU
MTEYGTGLHPEARALLDQFERDGIRPYDQLSVLQARAAVAAATRLQGVRTPLALVRDLLIDDALPARLYHSRPETIAPLVVYLHGGGFVTGSVAAADRPCRALAAASGCAVLSVEYRLAPENPFPVPVHDCLAAIRWASAHSRELGADPARMVLMGDSAGGALAAACTAAVRDSGDSPLAGQILVYPTLRPTRGNPAPSLQSNGEGYLMTRGSLEWFWGHYLRGCQDTTDPLAAPLLADDLSRLPATTVVVAEFDPLRDEGLAYADRLRAAGVPTTTHLVPGALHGFWWMDGVLAQARDLTEYLAHDLHTRFGFDD